ncbi:hypothetical protein Pla108_13920 [Botrimarina colliarenosi]|uniref:Uncharacterized protein n=1 Tax=Botrimarina colliarenosi TaxID=2528001 RepID=A0A5C6ALZ6_9BACT|nr:hypothetical protein Pla108_13920 [Botrimarina colliarenosi]
MARKSIVEITDEQWKRVEPLLLKPDLGCG